MKIKGTTSRFKVGDKVWVPKDGKPVIGEVTEVYLSRQEAIDEEQQIFALVFGYKVKAPKNRPDYKIISFEENETYASLSEFIEKRFGSEKLEEALQYAFYKVFMN